MCHDLFLAGVKGEVCEVQADSRGEQLAKVETNCLQGVSCPRHSYSIRFLKGTYH
jgi:hypothetical protein